MMDYGESKGDIWKIFYYTKKKIEIPEKEKQCFVDKQTRELGSTFDPPPGLSPADYSVMFMNHFSKSRSDARDLLEKGSESRAKYSSHFQIGNIECLDDMKRIENDPNFHSWENPELVSYFRTVSEMQAE